jgi:alpha-1,6-mannosyltransferase
MHWIYFPFFDHHIAVSRHTADELVAASTGHAVGRDIWIRHMGVDIHGFSPNRRSTATREWLRHRAGAGYDTKLLLYAGRVAPEKNLSLLIDVVRNLTNRSLDCCLILAGDGIDRARLEEVAQKAIPGKVCFLGHVSQRDTLADVYANCDVFVHPNPREPFGIAPLEAMASGIPLVAPDEGGITSFANHDNAFLAHADEESFSSAVLEALNFDGARTRVAAALRTAEQFRWDEATDSYLKLYDALYQAFRGEPAVEIGSPYARSTPATASGGAAITAAAWLSGHSFRLFVKAQSLLQLLRLYK